MSISAFSGRRRGRSRAAALTTVMVAALVSLVGLVAPAKAASKVAISNLVLVKSDINGNPSTSPIKLEDVVKLTFDWDGSKANLVANDSFSVDLPSFFDNLEHPQTRDLKVNHNGSQLSVGKCELTKKNITCTFNSKVEELRRQGFSGFRGTATALLKVTEVWKKGKAPITVNGTTTEVTVPGGGIGEKGKSTYSSNTFNKIGGNLHSKSTGIFWEINFNSNKIAEYLAAAGKPITLDGSTRTTIAFTDKLGPGQSFPKPAEIKLMMRNSAKEPNLANGVTLTDGSGQDRTQPYGNFDLKVDIKGNNATFTLTGPFARDTNYKLFYIAKPGTSNGIIQPGFKYTNSATLVGSGRDIAFERYYSDSFSVEVKMEAGFGSFGVTKLLSGNGSSAVAAGTKFTTKVKYTLPGGATVNSYPGWKAPGTVNASKTGGVVDFVVTAGQKVNFTAATFPRGTVIELSEDPKTASPAAPGIDWGTPEFKVGGTAQNAFTIVDRQSTAVELTNPVNLKTGTFSVSKSGSGANVSGKNFTFAFTCQDGQSGSVTAKGDGVPVQAGVRVPVGTTCTVTEDASSAGVDGYDLTAPKARTITISQADAVVPVAFVNAYTAQVGDFSIAKTVTGNDAAASRGFAFAYDCGPHGKGRLNVPGNGTPVTSPKIRAGAVCTIAEDVDAARAEGYSLNASISQNQVTIAKGKTVAVTAKNAYTRDTGKFSVAKKVASNGADFTGSTFDVDYVCSDGSKGSLKVPGNGTAVQGPVLPTGTTCDISEKASSAQRQGYSLATAVDTPKVAIVKGRTPAVTVTNTYTRLVGSFTIGKTVAGDGAALAPKSFDFAYSCVDASGAKTVAGEVKVAAGKSESVANVPTGSCTVSEKDSGVANASLQTALTVDGKAVEGSSATFEVADAKTVAVSATNTYTLDRATFSVAKTVEGLDAKLAPATFSFDYTCQSPEGEVSGKLDVPGDGSAVKADRTFPVGATCTVTENADSAQVANFDLAASKAQKITIGAKDSVKAISFTNAYAAHVGDFSVTKKVSGVAGQENREFAFAYTCTNGVSGTLKAKGDGAAVKSGQELPVGTQCTITETTDSAQIDGHTLKAPQAQTVTIAAKDQVVESTFVNDYTPVDKPTPKVENPTPEPSAQPSQPGKESPSVTAKRGTSLPRTGASILGLAALGLGALAVGAVLMARRRRS